MRLQELKESEMTKDDAIAWLCRRYLMLPIELGVHVHGGPQLIKFILDDYKAGKPMKLMRQLVKSARVAGFGCPDLDVIEKSLGKEET